MTDELDLKASLGHGATTIFIRAIAALLALATSVVLARVMSPSGFGTYSVIVSWIQLLLIPALLGMERLTLREVGRLNNGTRPAPVDAFLRWAAKRVFLSGFVVGTLAAGTAAIAAAAGVGEVELILIALPLLLGLALMRIGQAGLRGLNQFIAGQVPEGILLPVLLIGGSIGVHALLNEDLSSGIVLAIHAGAGLFALGLTFALLRPRRPPVATTAEPPEMPRLWATVTALMIIEAALVIISRSDLIMVGSLAGEREAAFYAVAQRGAEVVTLALTAFNIVIAPAIARLYAEGRRDELQALVRVVARVTSGVGILVAAIMLFAPGLFLGLFGVEFSEATGPLRILVLGRLGNLLTGPAALVLMMSGHERVAAVTVGGVAALNIAGNAVAIPILGPIGASIVTAISVMAWNVTLITWTRRQLGIWTPALGPITAVR